MVVKTFIAQSSEIFCLIKTLSSLQGRCNSIFTNITYSCRIITKHKMFSHIVLKHVVVTVTYFATNVSYDHEMFIWLAAMKARSDSTVPYYSLGIFYKLFYSCNLQYNEISLLDLSLKHNRRAGFKNVNNCLNSKIYSYFETSSGQSYNLYLNVVHFFNASVN